MLQRTVQCLYANAARRVHGAVAAAPTGALAAYAVVLTVVVLVVLLRSVNIVNVEVDDEDVIKELVAGMSGGGGGAFQGKRLVFDGLERVGKKKASAPPPSRGPPLSSAPPMFLVPADFLTGRASFLQSSPVLQEVLKPMLKGPVNHGYEFRNKVFSAGHGYYIDLLFSHKNTGFYIEAGAGNGESTHTLFLEVKRGWHGLLVEPNPTLYRDLASKGRKAVHLNACLSPTRHAEEAEFLMAGELSALAEAKTQQEIKRLMQYEQFGRATLVCLPFYSVYRALGGPTVDYLELDVQGAEFEVLKTVPWNEVDVRTMALELPESKCLADRLLGYMESQGYGQVYFFPRKKGGRLANRTQAASAGEDGWDQRDALLVRNGVKLNFTNFVGL